MYNNDYSRYVTWVETTLKGIKAYPQLSNGLGQYDSPIQICENFINIIKDVTGNRQFSDANKKTIVKLLKNNPQIKCIVEIGTASSYTDSSTQTFIQYKSPDTLFITIDIDNKSAAIEGNSLREKILVLQSDSVNVDLKKHFINTTIDLLFIDGDHSVDRVFKEYEFYLPLMSKNGIIVLHDTTLHPGPYLFMEAVDENVYKKEKLHLDDYGLGIIYL